MADNFEFDQVKSDLLYDLLIEKKSSKNPKILTKSKFLNGLQCPKLLWTCCNAPEQIPEPSESLQQIFDAGNRIGNLATKCFPGGVSVGQDDFTKNLEETKNLLSSKNPKPVYEAGILSSRIYARADILRPSERIPGAWDVIEVKCGTKCKEVYLQDIAFQKYCYEQSGLTIDRCFLMHINNEYVRQGDIDVEDLFTLLDVSVEILPFFTPLPKLITGLLEIIDLPSCPQISIREHCTNPYDCQMKSICWAFLPKANVLELSRGKPKGFDLIDQGIVLLKDIPDKFKLTDNQQIQRQCAISSREHVDREGISDFLKCLSYPLYFLDFETIFEVIPRFDGTRPYQQVPFQFSLHIQRAQGAPLEHFSFLYKNAGDPRSEFIKQLSRYIEGPGTVLVYNQSFEEGRLKELAEAYPEYKSWCEDVAGRMEDLYVPFRKFHYYNPQQGGSASIKKVLPALVGQGYEDLVVSGGQQASSEYVRVTYGEQINADEREQVYAHLEAYCALDTKAMMDILCKLVELS